MQFILTVIQDNQTPATLIFDNFKEGKKHYGRFINTRSTVSATLRDDRPGGGKVRYAYDRKDSRFPR